MKIRRQRILSTLSSLSLVLLEAGKRKAFVAPFNLTQKRFGIHRVQDTFLLLLVATVIVSSVSQSE